MRIRPRRTLSLFLAAGLLLSAAPAAAGVRAVQRGIPKHPRDLKEPAWSYRPPNRERYRHQLSSGAVAYVVEDHALPLVNVAVFIRAGSFVEPPGREGLAWLTGNQLRGGGTTTKTPDQFDEAAELLAADLNSALGELIGGANLNCLSKELDPSLALYFEMLRNPRFDEGRLRIAKNQMLQQMERRNDRTDEIEHREWGRLLRGPDHFTNRPPTEASLARITREDLLDFHKRYYHPGAFIFAVAGDFRTADMLSKLEAALKGWGAGWTERPPVPKPEYTPAAGVYLVNKAEAEQGRVSLGHLASTRDNPNYYALSLMNDILGGGGLTSRLMSRVRTDEGLAYSAGSTYGFGVYYPSEFRVSFQSKSASTACALQIALEEIERIRTSKVTAEELATAANAAVETVPRYFANPMQASMTFAQDEYAGRPADYWENYPRRIRAVTADEVLQVARKYLQPDRLVILIVGNIDDIMKGDASDPLHTVAALAGGKKIQRIPLPHPLTMAYPETR
jgi:zinc protease